MATTSPKFTGSTIKAARETVAKKKSSGEIGSQHVAAGTAGEKGTGSTWEANKAKSASWVATPSNKSAAEAKKAYEVAQQAYGKYQTQPHTGNNWLGLYDESKDDEAVRLKQAADDAYKAWQEADKAERQQNTYKTYSGYDDKTRAQTFNQLKADTKYVDPTIKALENQIEALKANKESVKSTPVYTAEDSKNTTASLKKIEEEIKQCETQLDAAKKSQQSKQDEANENLAIMYMAMGGEATYGGSQYLKTKYGAKNRNEVYKELSAISDKFDQLDDLVAKRNSTNPYKQDVKYQNLEKQITSLLAETKGYDRDTVSMELSLMDMTGEATRDKNLNYDLKTAKERYETGVQADLDDIANRRAEIGMAARARANDPETGNPYINWDDFTDEQVIEKWGTEEEKLELQQFASQEHALKEERASLRGEIQQAEEIQTYYKYFDLQKNTDFKRKAEEGKAINNKPYDPSSSAANGTMGIDWFAGSDNPAKAIRDNEVTSAELGDSYDPTYKYMTDTEYDIYEYLLAKEGKNKAEEYHRGILNTLNARYGQAIYENSALNSNSDFVKAVSGLGYSAVAGLDQFGSGFQNFLNQVSGNDADPTSAIQYAGGLVNQGLGEIGKSIDWLGGKTALQVGYEAGTTMANMAPSIFLGRVMGMLTPGMGAVGQFIAPKMGELAMGAAAGGNYYAEALAQGYTKEESSTYALLAGSAEIVLSDVLSGVIGIGGKLPDYINETVIKNIDNSFWRMAAELGTRDLSESVEEYMQEVLSPVFYNFASGDENTVQLFNNPEATYSFLMACITTTIMDFGPVHSNIYNKNTNRPETLGTKYYGEIYAPFFEVNDSLTDFIAQNTDGEISDFAKKLSSGELKGNVNNYGELVRMLDRAGYLGKDGKMTKEGGNILASGLAFELTTADAEEFDRLMSRLGHPDNAVVNEEVIWLAYQSNGKGIEWAEQQARLVESVLNGKELSDSAWKILDVTNPALQHIITSKTGMVFDSKMTHAEIVENLKTINNSAQTEQADQSSRIQKATEEANARNEANAQSLRDAIAPKTPAAVESTTEAPTSKGVEAGDAFAISKNQNAVTRKSEVGNTAVEETAVEETAVEETPTEAAPVIETPAEVAPTEAAPVEEAAEVTLSADKAKQFDKILESSDKRGRVSDKECETIINDKELKAAFEQKYGVELKGTKKQQREIIKSAYAKSRSGTEVITDAVTPKSEKIEDASKTETKAEEVEAPVEEKTEPTKAETPAEEKKAEIPVEEKTEPAKTEAPVEEKKAETPVTKKSKPVIDESKKTAKPGTERPKENSVTISFVDAQRQARKEAELKNALGNVKGKKSDLNRIKDADIESYIDENYEKFAYLGKNIGHTTFDWVKNKDGTYTITSQAEGKEAISEKVEAEDFRQYLIDVATENELDYRDRNWPNRGTSEIAKEKRAKEQKAKAQEEKKQKKVDKKSDVTPKKTEKTANTETNPDGTPSWYTEGMGDLEDTVQGKNGPITRRQWIENSFAKKNNKLTPEESNAFFNKRRAEQNNTEVEETEVEEVEEAKVEAPAVEETKGEVAAEESETPDWYTEDMGDLEDTVVLKNKKTRTRREWIQEGIDNYDKTPEQANEGFNKAVAAANKKAAAAAKKSEVVEAKVEAEAAKPKKAKPAVAKKSEVVESKAEEAAPASAKKAETAVTKKSEKTEEAKPAPKKAKGKKTVEEVATDVESVPGWYSSKLGALDDVYTFKNGNTITRQRWIENGLKKGLTVEDSNAEFNKRINETSQEQRYETLNKSASELLAESENTLTEEEDSDIVEFNRKPPTTGSKANKQSYKAIFESENPEEAMANHSIAELAKMHNWLDEITEYQNEADAIKSYIQNNATAEDIASIDPDYVDGLELNKPAVKKDITNTVSVNLTPPSRASGINRDMYLDIFATDDADDIYDAMNGYSVDELESFRSWLEKRGRGNEADIVAGYIEDAYTVDDVFDGMTEDEARNYAEGYGFEEEYKEYLERKANGQKESGRDETAESNGRAPAERNTESVPSGQENVRSGQERGPAVATRGDNTDAGVRRADVGRDSESKPVAGKKRNGKATDTGSNAEAGNRSDRPQLTLGKVINHGPGIPEGHRLAEEQDVKKAIGKPLYNFLKSTGLEVVGCDVFCDAHGAPIAGMAGMYNGKEAIYVSLDFNKYGRGKFFTARSIASHELTHKLLGWTFGKDSGKQSTKWVTDIFHDVRESLSEKDAKAFDKAVNAMFSDYFEAAIYAYPSLSKEEANLRAYEEMLCDMIGGGPRASAAPLFNLGIGGYAKQLVEAEGLVEKALAAQKEYQGFNKSNAVNDADYKGGVRSTTDLTDTTGRENYLWIDDLMDSKFQVEDLFSEPTEEEVQRLSRSILWNGYTEEEIRDLVSDDLRPTNDGTDSVINDWWQDSQPSLPHIPGTTCDTYRRAYDSTQYLRSCLRQWSTTLRSGMSGTIAMLSSDWDYLSAAKNHPAAERTFVYYNKKTASVREAYNALRKLILEEGAIAADRRVYLENSATDEDISEMLKLLADANSGGFEVEYSPENLQAVSTLAKNGWLESRTNFNLTEEIDCLIHYNDSIDKNQRNNLLDLTTSIQNDSPFIVSYLVDTAEVKKAYNALVYEALNGNEEKIKSAISDFGAYKAKDFAPIYYSVINRSLEKSNAPKYWGSEEKLLAYLRKTAKPEELLHLGLDPLTEEAKVKLFKDGIVTKESLQTYVSQHEPRIHVETGSFRWDRFSNARVNNYRTYKFIFESPNGEQYANQAMIDHWGGEEYGGHYHNFESREEGSPYNIIAHARTNDVTVPEYGRGLFIEENQSDFINAKKTDTESNLRELEAYRDEAKAEYEQLLNSPETISDSDTKEMEFRSRISELYDEDTGEIFLPGLSAEGLQKYTDNPGQFISDYLEAYEEATAYAADSGQPYPTLDALTSFGFPSQYLDLNRRGGFETTMGFEERLAAAESRLKDAQDKVDSHQVPPSFPHTKDLKSNLEYTTKYLLRVAAEGNYNCVACTTAYQQINMWAIDYAKAYEDNYDNGVVGVLRRIGKPFGVEPELKDVALAQTLRTPEDQRVASNTIPQEKLQKRRQLTQDLYNKTGNKSWVMELTPEMKQALLYEGQALYQVEDAEDSDAMYTQLYQNGDADFLKKRGVDIDKAFPEGSFERTLFDKLSNGNAAEVGEYLNDILNQAAEQQKSPRPTPNLPPLTNERLAAVRKKNAENIEMSKPLNRSEKQGRDINFAEMQTENRYTRRYVQNAATAAQMPEHTSKRIEDFAVTSELASYTRISNQSAIDYADETIRKKGIDGAMRLWDGLADSGHMPSVNDIALGQTLMLWAARNGREDLSLKLLADVSAMETAAGQIVQGARILKQLDPSYQLYYVQKAVERLNAGFSKQIGRGTMGEVTINEELAKAVLNAESEEALQSAMDALIEDLASQVPVSLKDKWDSWRYFSMLGNPRTHVRNMVGNAVFAPLVFGKNLMKMGAEHLFVSDVSQRTTDIFNRGKYRDFALSDFESMKPVITGEGKYSNNPRNAIMQKRRIWKTDAMNNMTDFVGKALEAEDALFLKPYYVNALSGYLAAQNFDMEDIDTPAGRKLLNEARMYAVNEAQRATYRDANVVASALNKMKQVPVMGLLLDGILPFTTTPLNILRRGVEYSPAQLIATVTGGTVKLIRGDMTVNAYLDKICSGMTGTMAAMLGFFLAKAGFLHGGNDDDKEGEHKELQGYQNFSLTVGDKNFTIDWSAPVALPLFVGTAAYELLGGDHELSVNEMGDAMMLLAEPMMQLSMLDGLNSTLSSLAYANKSQMVSLLAQQMLTSYAGQGIPTLLGQIARTFDDTRRSSYTDKNAAVNIGNMEIKIPGWIQYFIQSNVKNKVPIWEEDKMAYVDAWGRKDTEETWYLRAIENFLSPGYVKTITTTDADIELDRLYKATGDAGVLPTRGNKYFTTNGERYDFSADEYEAYLTSAGQEAFKTISELINTEAYAKLSDENKAEAVKNCYTYANERAKEQVVEGFKSKQNWLDKAEAFGVADYTATKSILSDTDNTNKEKFTVAFESKDLDLRQQSRIISDVFTASDTVNSSKTGFGYKLTDEQQKRQKEIYQSEFEKAYSALTKKVEWRTANRDKKLDMLDDLRSQTKTKSATILASELQRTGKGQEILLPASSVANNETAYRVAASSITGTYQQAQYIIGRFYASSSINKTKLTKEQKEYQKEVYSQLFMQGFGDVTSSAKYKNGDEDTRVKLITDFHQKCLKESKEYLKKRWKF